MKKSLIRIPTVDPKTKELMSRKKWLEQRAHGVGGSDIASVFGIDEYKPSIKLFHQKLGTWPTNEDGNVAAYSGSVVEDHIYKMFWRYWNPEHNSDEVMVQNARADEVIRKASRINAILYDPDMDWIRANIDYRIHKYGDKGSGVLELKYAGTSYWNKYEAGIPPGYIFQINTYMGVTGMDWGEIFALKDGKYPEIFTFKLNEALFGKIVERTKEFWDNVLICREILNDSSIPEDKKYMMITEYEPDPENTEAYEEYMKARYRSENHKGEVAASKAIEKARKKYWEHHEAMMIAKKNKQMEKNIILREIEKYGVSAIVMNDDKKITWFDRITIPKIVE